MLNLNILWMLIFFFFFLVRCQYYFMELYDATGTYNESLVSKGPL